MKKKLLALIIVCLVALPLTILAGTSMFAEEGAVVYLSDAGDDANDGASAATAVKTMAKAYEVLGTEGGNIVIADKYTTDNHFVAPDHTGKITIKGANASAVFEATGFRFQSGGPLEFTDIKINQTKANFMVVGNFNDLTFTSTVTHERGTNASFIVAGGQGGNVEGKDRDYTVKSTTLTLEGGNWSEVIGSIRSGLNSPSGAHDPAEFKDYTLTINVGGDVTVGKIAAFSRSYGDCTILAANSECIINLNGGMITAWAGMTDTTGTAKVKVGYEKGITYNIGKNFKFAESFELDEVNQRDNIVTDSSGNKIFYGLNGDNVFTYHSTKVLPEALGMSKVVIAEELYGVLSTSPRLRGVLVLNAANPNDPDAPFIPDGSETQPAPDTDDAATTTKKTPSTTKPKQTTAKTTTAAPEASSPATTQAPADNAGGINPIVIVAIAAGVIACVAVVVIIIAKKKKQ